MRTLIHYKWPKTKAKRFAFLDHCLQVSFNTTFETLDHEGHSIVVLRRPSQLNWHETKVNLKMSEALPVFGIFEQENPDWGLFYWVTATTTNLIGEDISVHFHVKMHNMSHAQLEKFGFTITQIEIPDEHLPPTN